MLFEVKQICGTIIRRNEIAILSISHKNRFDTQPDLHTSSPRIEISLDDYTYFRLSTFFFLCAFLRNSCNVIQKFHTIEKMFLREGS